MMIFRVNFGVEYLLQSSKLEMVSGKTLNYVYT